MMETKKKETVYAIRYQNSYLRIAMALLAAHLLVTLGKKIRFLDALQQPFYYISVTASFIIAYILITTVHFTVTLLDKRYSWTAQPLQRTGLQLLLGLIAPCILAYVLAWGYFACFGIDIHNTSYSTYEFPFITVMLLLVNVYYLAYYFYLAYQASLQQKTAGNIVEKKVFIVHTPLKSIPLPIKEISYFYRRNESNFVRTFDRTDYIVPYTLGELEEQFPEFNRVNRQVIANIKSIDEYRPGENGKLELHLRPPLNEPVVVSAKNVTRFKEWIEQ